MAERCPTCDREGCNAIALANAWVNCDCERVSCEHRDAAFPAMDDCEANTVNWRRRAKKSEAIIAATTERATALSRAGLGTVEPWAQAGQVLREIAGQMLACLRGEDVPPVVLIPADDWVPVTERLPMDLLNRNVMDAQGNVGTARQRLPYAAGIWDKTGSETLGMITHWKDLPEGFDTGLCASCCGTGLTDLHYCDGVIFQPRLCPCGCPQPLPAAPEVQAVAQKTAAFRPTPEQMRMGVFSEADLDLDGVDL